MKNNDLRILLLLTIQKALLGEITPNIRAIQCGFNRKEVIIKSYFNGEISEEEKESMSLVATEVIASVRDLNISD